METNVGYGLGIQALLDKGVEIRCGNCNRRLATEHAPKTHRVYDDGSGRCFEEDGHSVDGNRVDGVRASFMASLEWAKRVTA